MDLTYTISDGAPSIPVTYPLVRADSRTTALFCAYPLSAVVSPFHGGSETESGNAPLSFSWSLKPRATVARPGMTSRPCHQ